MTQPVDYDPVANSYSSRYERHDYAGIEQALVAFVEPRPPMRLVRVLEVGCGTGHWLEALKGCGAMLAGTDVSGEMLRIAHAVAPRALLIRGRAEALPWQGGSFDRLCCIHALHHFTGRPAFLAEAHRVLRPGGGMLVVSLDPHTGRDQWWIYEHFPEAHVADRRRYPSSEAIREMMAASGFERCTTREAEHLSSAVGVVDAERRGLLDRASTSQLMVISDDEYHAGRARIRRIDAEAGGTLVLRADLRLYATVGWRAGAVNATSRQRSATSCQPEGDRGGAQS